MHFLPLPLPSNSNTLVKALNCSARLGFGNVFSRRKPCPGSKHDVSWAATEVGDLPLRPLHLGGTSCNQKWYPIALLYQWPIFIQLTSIVSECQNYWMQPGLVVSPGQGVWGKHVLGGRGNHSLPPRFLCNVRPLDHILFRWRGQWVEEYSYWMNLLSSLWKNDIPNEIAKDSWYTAQWYHC